MSRRPGRVADRLIRASCRRLPSDLREDRYREWAAELPAILHDPDVPSSLLRRARALRYATGVARYTSRSDGSQSRRATAAGWRDGAPASPSGPALRLTAGLAICLILAVALIAVIRLGQVHSPWPLLPVAAAAVGFVGYCLTDLARADEVRYLPRWAWALACLTSVPLGGICYLSVGRVRRSGRRPDPARPD